MSFVHIVENDSVWRMWVEYCIKLGIKNFKMAIYKKYENQCMVVDTNIRNGLKWHLQKRLIINGERYNYYLNYGKSQFN